MFKFRFATESEIAERKRLTLDFLDQVEAQLPHTASKQSGPNLPPELCSYLQLVADAPGISVTEREQGAGIYARKGKAIREELLRRGLIVETETRKGVGRPVKDIRLTEKAWQIIGRKPEASC